MCPRMASAPITSGPCLSSWCSGASCEEVTTTGVVRQGDYGVIVSLCRSSCVRMRARSSRRDRSGGGEPRVMIDAGSARGRAFARLNRSLRRAARRQGAPVRTIIETSNDSVRYPELIPTLLDWYENLDAKVALPAPRDRAQMLSALADHPGRADGGGLPDLGDPSRVRGAGERGSPAWRDAPPVHDRLAVGPGAPGGDVTAGVRSQPRRGARPDPRMARGEEGVPTSPRAARGRPRRARGPRRRPAPHAPCPAPPARRAPRRPRCGREAVPGPRARGEPSAGATAAGASGGGAGRAVSR